jgi:hypothetical protein
MARQLRAWQRMLSGCRLDLLDPFILLILSPKATLSHYSNLESFFDFISLRYYRVILVDIFEKASIIITFHDLYVKFGR